MKAIIFDASTIINFAMNGMLNELKKLKENFDGKFLVTKDVKYEIVDKPLTIRRFEFQAMKINQLLKQKVIEMPSSLEIDEKQINKETTKLVDIANNTFKSQGKFIKIIDRGEVSCLVLSKLLTQKQIKNVCAIDERTTRMLVEKPKKLRKLLSRKLHKNIDLIENNFSFFEGYKIIRSAELYYVLYKKNIIQIKNSKLLDALMYAAKFKGCAISSEEINEIKRL